MAPPQNTDGPSLPVNVKPRFRGDSDEPSDVYDELTACA